MAAAAAPATAAVRATTSSGRAKLTHLAGLRAAASLWIVLGHFMMMPREPTEAVLGRGTVAVQIFVMLSGLVTSYAYSSRDYSTWTAIFRFYARRFGAILFSYYATWLLMLLLSYSACASGSCIGDDDRAMQPAYALTRGIMSLAMVQSLVDPMDPYFPNGPAWTLSTLAILWLMWPFLLNRLTWLLRKRPLLAAFMAFVITQVPVFAALVWRKDEGRFFITENQYLVLYHHPLGPQLGNFLFGMALAELLVQGRLRPSWTGWAAVADLSAAIGWAVVAFIPRDPRSRPFPLREGYEGLFISVLQPISGVPGPGPGSAARPRPWRARVTHCR